MGSVTVINRIIVKPGKMEAFIDAQRRYVCDVAPSGLLEGRMYRGLDGQSAVLVSTFRSKHDHELVMQRADFKEHVQRLQPLVESSSPSLYEQVP